MQWCLQGKIDELRQKQRFHLVLLGDWCVKLFASAPSGLNPTLKQERKAAGSIVVGDKVQVTFSYKGSLTGESGTVSIQSFVEATNGASQIETFDVTPTNTWQTFTTTYTVTVFARME